MRCECEVRREDLQVAEGDAVGQGEGTLSLDDVVDTVVGREVGLDFVEDDHRAVSSSTLQLAALGEADGVVESQLYKSQLEAAITC